MNNAETDRFCPLCSTLLPIDNVQCVNCLLLDRNVFFGQCLAKLQEFNNNFDEVHATSNRLASMIGRFSLQFNPIQFFDDKIHQRDEIADRYLVNFETYVNGQLNNSESSVPVKTLGNGNCLYNSVCLLASWTPLHSIELRVRTIIELSRYKEFYINKYTQSYALNDGHNFIDGEENLDQHITRNILYDGQAAERWELAAIATVLNCNVVSLYPVVCKEDLQGKSNNMTYSPRTSSQNKPHTIRIFWTHASINPDEIQDHRLWRANHFVPLLCKSSSAINEVVNTKTIHSPNATSSDSSESTMSTTLNTTVTPKTPLDLTNFGFTPTSTPSVISYDTSVFDSEFLIDSNFQYKTVRRKTIERLRQYTNTVKEQTLKIIENLEFVLQTVHLRLIKSLTRGDHRYASTWLMAIIIGWTKREIDKHNEAVRGARDEVAKISAKSVKQLSKLNKQGDRYRTSVVIDVIIPSKKDRIVINPEFDFNHKIINQLYHKLEQLVLNTLEPCRVAPKKKGTWEEDKNHNEYWAQFGDAIMSLIRKHQYRLRQRNKDVQHTHYLQKLKIAYAACVASLSLRWYASKMRWKNTSLGKNSEHQDAIIWLMSLSTVLRSILPQDLTATNSLLQVYRYMFNGFHATYIRAIEESIDTSVKARNSRNRNRAKAYSNGKNTSRKNAKKK